MRDYHAAMWALPHVATVEPYGSHFVAAVGFCLLAVTIASACGPSRTSAPPSATAFPPTPTTLPAPSRDGEVKVDLGVRSLVFGSAGQAAELLKVIEGNPGKAVYTIAYRTDVDVVAFGCDLNKERLVRVHQEAGNPGKAETWSGYVLERLRNAASGGSLNDTPAGKLFGTFESLAALSAAYAAIVVGPEATSAPITVLPSPNLEAMVESRVRATMEANQMAAAMATPTAARPAISAAAPVSARVPEAAERFWTVTVVTYTDSPMGAEASQRMIRELSGKGLPAEMLASSHYPSMRPGFLVVYSGRFPTKAQAESHLSRVRNSGYADAYVRVVP